MSFLPILLIIVSRSVHQLEGVFIKKYNAKHEKGGFIFTAIVSLFSMVFFLLADIFTDKSGLRFLTTRAKLLSPSAVAKLSTLHFARAWKKGTKF